MNSALAPQLNLHDYQPELEQFRGDVITGLSQTRKELPCKYFYDERGSHLFDQICTLDEYYPTRTEMMLMCRHGREIGELLGPHCRLVEYGSGSGRKTRILLDNLPHPAAYVPLDISRGHLLLSASTLAAAYPGLLVQPVCADYTGDFELPPPPRHALRTVVYFPGSTIGNFHPAQALQFLRHIAQVCGANGGLLIGVDLKKDAAVLEPAYNDSLGVTADFNLNLLRRVNEELGADFNLDGFAHRAFYNAELGRIEMHLVSRAAQTVYMPSDEGERLFHFAGGETIHTENSYKYSLAEFARLAGQAGFRVERTWVDDRNLFSVQYLVVEEAGLHAV